MSERATAVNLPKRYKYSSRQCSSHGRWYYYYEVVGERGAVHLHLHKYDDAKEWIGGVEFHYLTRPDYMEPQPPHHAKCPLLEQPCWHDGSSLAADDYVWMHEGGYVEQIFAQLVDVADDRFGNQAEHKTAQQKLAEAVSD